MSLKHAILVILESETGTGYDIAKKFRGSSGNFWNASHQQVYQELSKLGKLGLVKWRSVLQQGKPDKKVYTITEQGRQEIQDWMSTPLPAQKVRDHLLVRMTAAHLIDSTYLSEQIKEHMERCDKKLKALKQYEAAYYQQEENKTLERELLYLSIIRGIELQETWLIWAEKVLSVLHKYR